MPSERRLRLMLPKEGARSNPLFFLIPEQKSREYAGASLPLIIRLAEKCRLKKHFFFRRHFSGCPPYAAGTVLFYPAKQSAIRTNETVLPLQTDKTAPLFKHRFLSGHETQSPIAAKSSA
ncbi:MULTISPECIES: hypothetical protein [Neisseria]|uniref:hypothetical protein n=1 Tax=Neisseria TaxID=482 RepID=UPI000E0DEBE7|nr:MULTISPECIES: hypothetical protein [Neisseria]